MLTKIDPETLAEMRRESRLRSLARRQGYRLVKSRTRNPDAWNYGTFAIVDPDRNCTVAGDISRGYGLDLDEVEDWLSPPANVAE